MQSSFFPRSRCVRQAEETRPVRETLCTKSGGRNAAEWHGGLCKGGRETGVSTVARKRIVRDRGADRCSMRGKKDIKAEKKGSNRSGKGI